MKDKTIIIKDNEETLGIGYQPIAKNLEHASCSLIVEETDPKFVIINDFSSKTKSSMAPEEEKVEVKENIYYAEEVFDDEDDIYVSVTNDSLLQTEHHRSFFEIGETINNAVSKYGYKTNIGLSLIASMQFSRLIYLPLEGSQTKFVSKLFESIGNPKFMMSSSAGGQDDYLAYEADVYKAIEYAVKNKNKPVFIYVDNLLSKDVFNYFHHFYSYIDNPDGDTYLTALGKSIYIPHNLYFIFSLQEKQIPCDMARRLYRYVSYLEVSNSEIEASETKENLSLSLEEIRASLREAADTYGIKEEMWKNFDGLIEVIHDVNGFVLQNKIARRLEDYAIALFTSPLSTVEVMDHLLANNFIHEAIITTKPQLYRTSHDLSKAIDNNFGPGALPLTLDVIKKYLKLFDKGGKRIDG